jgi:glycosyltransferase involved in cell wall biosynthesis
MRAASDGFEPILLAHAASPGGRPRLARVPGSDDPTQVLFLSDAAAYDRFTGRADDGGSIADAFEDVLRELQPDVVHFQHTLFLGYDLIGVARRTLPDAAIVYTLHEYLPICHHEGQMVRTYDRKPCLRPGPRDCARCFPGISAGQLLLRRRHTQSQFAMVDRFIAPSQFLRDRYVEWGIVPERIIVEENGRPSADRVESCMPARPRHTLGFFGQLTPFKGADVLLCGMRLLAEQGSAARLRIHGANLERQRSAFRREVRALLDNTSANTTLHGPYRRDELPRLMADVDWVVVPSIWWENAPLVIQEAFQHGRPVICSDIGGMAEKVKDGVNGLHFRAGDPASLAGTITRAIETPALWSQLAAGVPRVHSMRDHVARLEALYDALIDARRGELVGPRCEERRR